MTQKHREKGIHALETDLKKLEVTEKFPSGTPNTFPQAHSPQNRHTFHEY